MAEYDVAVVGGGLVGTATAYELGVAGRADAARRPGRRRPGHRRRRGHPLAGDDEARRPGLGRARPAPRAGTTSSSCPRLDGRHRLGALRHPAARDARRATCRRGNGSPSARRVRPRSVRTTRVRWCRCSATSCARCITRPRRASTVGSMCAALRRAAVEEYGVDVRDESVDDVRALPADAIVIAGGAWTGAGGEQLGVTLPVGPVRGQIIHLGVAGHDTGAWPIVQPVFGYYMVPWADARRRGRRDGRGRRLRGRRHRRGSARGAAGDVARHARARGRDAARGAGRAPAGQRRRRTDPRRAPRVRRTCSSPPVTAPNGLLLGPVSGCARRRRRVRSRTRARPHAVRCGPFPREELTTARASARGRR